MNDNPPPDNIRKLSGDIETFRNQCADWWRYNARRKSLLLIASIVLARGATIAGAWDQGYVGATFSALGGSVIAAQNGFKFAEQTKFYGRAMTECDRLTRKLTYQTKTPVDFDGVAQAFDQLRNQEGAEGEQK